MKRKLAISFGILFLISSCLGGNNKFKKIPKFEYGKIENNTYVNAFLGLEIALPNTWTIDTTKKYKSPFSPHFLEADFFDQNQNALISLNIIGHKKNPFSKDETLIQYLEDSNENLALLYEKDEHREFMQEVKIAKSDFIRNRVILLVESQALFMDEYATEKNGYYYSMTFSYSDTLKRPEINDMLTRIKIK